ncbi:GIP, partial [Symbiodinium pilosum]
MEPPPELRATLHMQPDEDSFFKAKLDQLQQTLPFGSRKTKAFVFTGISLEQLPDYTIKANQKEYV